ncbi:EAL domain-containing protein [Desulfovulcanus sp.]
MSTEITLTGLEKALANEEFVFFYQAQVSLLSGNIVGLEALIRWRKQRNEIVPPYKFIPLAEEIGFINKITLGMFPKLVSDMIRISKIDPQISVSFNISARDLDNDNFKKELIALKKRNVINPQKLQIEITETAVLKKSETLLQILQEIKSEGFCVVMDDFATGYSSLEVFSTLPFDVIKVDKSIIEKILYSDRSLSIFESAVYLAHKSGVKLIAEGVEDEETYKLISKIGGEYVQGYIINKPAPLEDVIELIRNKKRWHVYPETLIHMAQIDHIEWRKILVAFLAEKISDQYKLSDYEDLEIIPLDHYECRLGKWYYGAGSIYKGIEYFDKLEEPHKLYHSIAKKIFEVVKKGGTKEEIISLTNSLNRVSLRILSILQKLESYLYLEMDKSEKERIIERLSE